MGLERWLPWRRLEAAGFLGMNRRNGDYLLPGNPRGLCPLVDDKLRTKQLAQAAGMAAPELYGVIEVERQIRDLPSLLESHREFVVKPARGSGGAGVLVIDGMADGQYRKASGALLETGELEHHLSNILAGLYSLGGQPDRALLEYRAHSDPLFEHIAPSGVADIRILVYRGVPVMAMLRLPTRQSDGKSNLHQGAVGVGVSLSCGRTGHAIWHERWIDAHPDTGRPVSGLSIPHWSRMLELAARCHELTGLGYIGVDLVLDREYGPLLMEINARPGLAIQLANRSGLLPRLRRVDSWDALPGGAEHRARLARELD
jgi:alpha-L-glutamate ligase-like protein